MIIKGSDSCWLLDTLQAMVHRCIQSNRKYGSRENAITSMSWHSRSPRFLVSDGIVRKYLSLGFCRPECSLLKGIDNPCISNNSSHIVRTIITAVRTFVRILLIPFINSLICKYKNQPYYLMEMNISCDSIISYYKSIFTCHSRVAWRKVSKFF